MSALLTEYEVKVSEINIYFAFLNDLLKRDAQLLFPRARKRRSAQCSDDLLRILKANAFLLLYNLVESSVRAGIGNIYDVVRSEGLSYTTICQELRAIWTNQKFAPDEGRKAENNAKRLMELIDSVLAAELINLEVRDLPIAGNVDADQIRILSNKYGFRFRSSARLKGGVLLKRVKDERNSLAHGYKSFIQCGRDATLDDLIEIHRQVIPYIRQFLRGIDTFIQKRRYAS